MTETTWQQLLERAALAFRLGREGEGSDTLVDFIDWLLAFLKEGDRAEVVQIQSVLEPMLQAQERGDLLFLADLLEYDLAPLLGRVV